VGSQPDLLVRLLERWLMIASTQFVEEVMVSVAA
jgi:hypothetical protein